MVAEKWMVHSKKADFDGFAKALGVSPIVARIMRNKDLESIEAQRAFLDNSLEGLHNPSLMKDMDKAIDIIKLKIEEGKHIRVIGDYDIDGICSTYILVKGLQQVGAFVTFDIPDRILDGYGINENLIKKAYDEGVDTIVTCDNGIAAIEQIKYAKELGMTVIVTDHHEVPYVKNEVTGEITYKRVQGDAVVNPKQPDCDYPFKLLCGGAIAYKVIESLYNKLDVDNKKEKIEYFIEYATIATIGDVVDLVGENRIIAANGLRALQTTANIGLDKLMDMCGINRERLSSYHIGFVIGPCLNATGRLESAKKGIELLMCEDFFEAEKLASELIELNGTRKAMTEEGVKEAIAMCESMEDSKVLVVYLPKIHESIAGIIAGRVREHFNKPVFVVTNSADENEESLIKGSGRSIPGYNMFEALIECDEYLLKYGGHEMAAGLSLDREMIEDFAKALNENCKLTEDDYVRKVWIDVPMPLAYATEELINQLSLLEPFGKGNEKPVFATKNVKVKSLKVMGANQNMCKLSVVDDSGKAMDALVFSSIYPAFMEFLKDKFGEEQIRKAKMNIPNDIVLSIIYYPDINEYNGRRSVQIIVNNYC
ncbi:MAG: single-stranded-DNA-specific exonuclease RecJ [Lachnospiraceae bacterium]|nr:single-stranded-DNA-specific exonuclease RecJ [Lachnospiraceae bacterium]